MHNAPDFFVAPDNRIDFFLSRKGGKVAAIFVQRLHSRFGVLICYALVAAHGFKRFQNRRAIYAVLL